MDRKKTENACCPMVGGGGAERVGEDEDTNLMMNATACSRAHSGERRIRKISNFAPNVYS